jgi:preprotein translocase subunit SecG
MKALLWILGCLFIGIILCLAVNALKTGDDLMKGDGHE